MWSCSSKEIHMRTHSKTTCCHIQGTEVDVLHDLIASASFSPKPLAFTFIGDEHLAPAKPSRGIPEGIEILQTGVTQSQQEFPMVMPRGGDVLAPFAANLSPPNDHHLPRSKPNPCSFGRQTPILMFFKEHKGHEQLEQPNLESPKDEILFFS